MAPSEHPESGAAAPNSEMTPFPTFLDTDPFPSSFPDGRPVSAGSATTDATTSGLEIGGEDFRSAKERQSTIPSTTGPVGEPGLPPSRPSSTGFVQAQRASMRTTAQPPSARRGFPAMMRGSARQQEGGDANRPLSPVNKTHVPTVNATGFANPLSSRALQAQRSQRLGAASPEPTLAGAAPRIEDSPERGPRHRYSDASVNTLRDGLPPPTDDAPPLPISRGTDGTQDYTNQAFSVASSTAPLTAKQSDRTLSVQPQPSFAREPKTPLSPQRSLRNSLRLSSRGTSWQRASTQHQQLHSDPSSPANEPNEKPPLPAIEPPKGQGKNYEHYAGNALFFLGGRLLNTKAKPLSVATFSLTALPAILFFIFSAPWLWHHVSPAIPIIFAYVFYITASSFFHASFSDPGILPRNMHPHPANPDEDADPLTVGPPTTAWVMIRTFNSKPLTPANLEAGQQQQQTAAMEVPSKFCKSCNIWRPPRAHHCRVCDGCVETQDHHCVWLNNCVGRRNYCYFYSYIASATLMALLLIAFAATHVQLYAQQNGIGFRATLSGRTQERVAFALLLYAALAFAYPASLWGYHIFLIARGETTREYLNTMKFAPKDRHRPFSQNSWARNWLAVLLRPRPPTYMQFRHRYREGDLRLGHQETKRERRRGQQGRYSVEMDQLPKQKEKEGQAGAGAGAGGSVGGGGSAAGGVVGPVNNTPR